MFTDFGSYFRAHHTVSLFRLSICFALGAAVSSAFTGPQPAVVVTPNPLVFATLQVQRSSTESITVTNTGTADLSISDIRTGPFQSPFSFIYTAGDCDYRSGAPIPPGGTCEIQVYFYPTAVGQYSATISITDNASDSPQSIPVSGTAVPNLACLSLQILSRSTPKKF